jgi:hypothetical protein
MGFIFGKVKKYCLRKEGAIITEKRRLYLKKRLMYNDIIAQNQATRNDWITNKRIGPITRQIMYIYILMSLMLIAIIQ